MITDLDAKRTAKVADALTEETGRKVLGRALDVTDEARVAAVVEEILAERGRIDILVNNAGTSEPAPLWETTMESWRRVVDVCLTGHFLTMRAVLPQMIERGSGSIINIASIEAWTSGTPGNTAYHAAKAGVLALTRSTAKQVAPYGVRVNAVAPGLVPNPFLSQDAAGGPSGEVAVRDPAEPGDRPGGPRRCGAVPGGGRLHVRSPASASTSPAART